MTSYKQFQNEKEEPTPVYSQGIQTEAIPNNRSSEQVCVQKYRDQVHSGWIALSVLNFIFCAWAGIPALIFSILGYEADKMENRREAQRYLHWVKAFNLLCCIMTGVGGFIGLILVILNIASTVRR